MREKLGPLVNKNKLNTLYPVLALTVQTGINSAGKYELCSTSYFLLAKQSRTGTLWPMIP